MAVVTGDRYLEHLVRFVGRHAGPLLDGTLTLKLNPVGLNYVQSRLEALRELEGLHAGAPVDYLRAYVSDLGDHRALEQLRRILWLLTSLKVISVLPVTARDPTPILLLPFSRIRVLELRGCDLSTAAVRGLLELRHTLEKLICHNSTDALRHVFASRIADIKDSPVWYRLSSVSCACNGLLLMDESLQLLPVVETLDLSRNHLAKLDNLWKCTKLKCLDLGFNQLRTMASLSEAKHFRLASIEDDKQRRDCCSGIVDQESISCDSESLGKDENAISDDHLEIDGLMNRAEYMKERVWLDQTPGVTVGGSQCVDFNLSSVKEKYVKQSKVRNHLGESSTYVTDMVQVLEDESSSNILESDMSFSDTYIGVHGNEFFETNGRGILEPPVLNGGLISVTDLRIESSKQGQLKVHSKLPQSLSPLSVNGHSNYSSSTVEGIYQIDQKINPAPLTAIDEIIGSHASSICPGSPPHYQQDILLRHFYLEEFLQLSTEPLSVASSDSDTSSSDADSCRFHASVSDLD